MIWDCWVGLMSATIKVKLHWAVHLDGWGDLEESFASVGVMLGNYIDPGVLSKSRTGQFYYLSLEARYRFQDITIDGARPKHLFDVHTEHWQATISTGAIYYQESWG